MTFFIIYVMELAGIIQIGTGFVVNYFPLIVWGIIFGWLVIPLPILSWEARWLLLKRILLTFISPIYGSPFYTIWIIEQMISMI